MSGSSSSVVAAAVVGGGGDGYRPPFTAGQWQELEHQALIYKYLVAGLPVPTDLVMPIRRSLDALSATARFFHHPSLGYCSYYGKKFDPEPGRCRRTDGKKWRCSKDAYPDSKYCERHMHRGRNRSRKPVESQSQSTSQSLSTAMSHITTASSGCYQTVGSGSFQNLPLYPVANSEGLGFGSNVSKYQVESSPYGISNKDYRYNQGISADVGDHNYSSEASGSMKGLGTDSNLDGGWRLMPPSQVPSSSVLKPRNDSYLQGQLSLPQSYEQQPIIDASAAMSKQRQQHCFFGNEVSSSAVPVKQEQHNANAMRPLFDEWPKTRDSWADLDDENKNAFSTTQLSISIPMASEFSTRSDCSPNDARDKSDYL